jgi:pimeloyl-ACP methyl ester carboxylesterase
MDTVQSNIALQKKEGQMQTIRSSDGTRIAYQRNGQGSPLILVHGTTADHTRWVPILPMLERSFTVYAVDRRGRGESGDTEHYAIEQEFEDIVAVINSIAKPVFLLGHSYGAICSLEAARRTTHVRKLVLYEPPIPTGIEIYPHEVVNRIQALLDAGDREGALTTFMQDIVHVPPHEMEMLRSSPSWQARIAAAHTILRELRGSNEYVFEPARFSNLTTPTLLLLGGDSPAFLKAGTEAVHAALPNSRVCIMPGQQHTAMNTAPELFTREVCEFLAQAG